MEIKDIDLKIKKISDLEKKYMEIIWKIITSDDFHNELENIESEINNQYLFIENNYQIKNKIQVAAERLLEFYILKSIEIVSVYPSPISSDFSYYTEDCLLNIDAKTIDLHGNKGDDSYIQFGPHQISFTNSNFYSQKVGGIFFDGITIPGGIPKESKKENLPSLTYFIGITYNDNGIRFKIEHVKLSCIPNGLIVEKEFKNNLISNFKTYKYVTADLAKKLGEEYKPKKAKNSSWIPFKLTNSKSKKELTYLDPKTPDIINNRSYSIWKKISGIYQMCYRADTGRIKPEMLEKRKDSSGTQWLGIRKAKFKSKDLV